ncbi:MAG: hypothetical protein EU547_04095 [Promethearchaeota archaeon]|nr:MAG: hypothetical protein EU547_04095 [Candidatus Lokiarchaeota archaeon]
MPLSNIQLIDGFLSLLVIIFAVFIGLNIVIKYFKYKRSLYILVGFSVIGLVSAWYPKALAFFMGGITLIQYAFFSSAFYPITILIWLFAFSDLLDLNKGNKSILLYSFLAIGVLFEIYLFTLITLFPDQIGTLDGLDMDYNLVFTAYQIILVLIFFITFILFGKESISSMESEIKLKGVFIIMSAFLFTGGAIFEILSSINIIILIIAKALLLLSTFAFYCGFFLPEWVKSIILKRE